MIAQINWIKCSERMPPDDDREIFIRKLLDSGEWYQTPSDEIWFEIGEDKLHEWEWTPYTQEAWKELNK